MARKKKQPEEPPSDPTSFLLESGWAEFALMHTKEIKYMCMLGYTFLHGSKVFSSIKEPRPFSFKFVNMILACTGGGILVPIFINSVPVPLCQDAYPIAIFVSFMLHYMFPVLREVLALSPVFKSAIVVLYEIMRAAVVMKLTAAAGKAIPSSEWDFPVFGPIFCGTIAGCGGAFLPLDKGLAPIKEHGLQPNMLSALIAATGYHLFMNTHYSNGVINAGKKAHVIVTTFFVLQGLYHAKVWKMSKAETKKVEANGDASKPKVKKEL